MSQTQTNQVPEKIRKSQKRVKVRYYIGSNKILYFYVGEEVERVAVNDQKWPEEVIKYVMAKGRHKVVKRRG